jgi:DNA-binding transcriptional MerR regulator
MKHDIQYSIGTLAELGGVSRRTVRYYVQQGLISTPQGLGRGAYYGPEHLEQLLRIKTMQEQGLTLDAIRQALAVGTSPVPRASAASPVSRSHWSRLVLMPGVELHVSSQYRLPPPGKLAELADWCQRTFGVEKEEEDG